MYRYNLRAMSLFTTLKCFRVDAITEKRIKRWALSMEDLVSDATGK